MVRIFRHYVSPIKLTLAITDFALTLAAAFVAEWLRYVWLGIEADLTTQAILVKFLLPVFLSPILFGIGGYHSDSIRDIRVFFLRLVIAVVVTGIIVSAFLYFIRDMSLWRSTLVLSLSFAFLFISSFHILFLAYAGNKFLGRNTVIVGHGKELDDLIDYISKATEAGLNIVAIIYNKNNVYYERKASGDTEIKDFLSFLDCRNAESIILANEDYSDLPVDTLIAAKLAGIEIQDRLSFFEQVRAYVALPAVTPEWIILSDGFRGGVAWEKMVKRTLDVIVSVTGLIVAAPVMIVTAFLISVTSKGPVFYRQERVGLGNVSFAIIKFRSMVVDAEKNKKPSWAANDDPRVTGIGRFIRRTRIDELPQLFNVLKGDMSFVGPRPERPYFVEQLKKEIPYYRERHCVKPGITGWAQIRYPYGASTEDARRKLEYDLYYIKNFSIVLDVLIILQTVRVILFPVGVR